MAIAPINVARVSNNLRAFNVLQAVRANEGGMFRVQNQLATGLRFLRPSEDPVAAARAGKLDLHLDLLTQLQSNLQAVAATLNEGESAASEAVDLMTQARSLASESINDSNSAEERASLANVADSLLDRLIAVANRQHLGAYLVSGNVQGRQPFQMSGDGVQYVGDDGRRNAIVDTDLSQAAFTIPGSEFFNAVSAEVRGDVDLDPSITLSTRLSDLRGTTGNGVAPGAIRITVGSQQVDIDLSQAATVGDVLDKLNDELPPPLQAGVTTSGIIISWSGGGSPQFTIDDATGGTLARDLGIRGAFTSASAGGADLDPRLSDTTPIFALFGGGGIDTSESIVIRNGSRSATIDFSAATNVQDLLNAIRRAGLGVQARISEDGRSLTVANGVSGSALSIEENGGTLATTLGIRSMRGDTTLASLNDGYGVQTVPGNDFRITTADGTAFEVDVDGATTVQDVIDRINAAGGGAVLAQFASTGNGIVISDQTSGAGSILIERVGASPAIDGLGFDGSASGTQLVGRDTSPVRVDSAFTALIELRDALRANDRTGLTRAGQRIERVLDLMQTKQGILATTSAAMEERTQRVETETTSTQVMLSDARDVDIAEAITNFQQFQTALQANLATAQRVMNLSLLDYLQ